MSINVGSLVVEMSANVARLQADMNQARAAVERATAGIASAATAARNALGALGVGLSAAAFASSIKSTVDFADHLNDLSQQLGISVKGLASWKLAADQSGTNLESIARAVKTLSTQMVDQSAKFKAAGITATDANGALIQLADVFARLPDGMQKTNLAVSLFGKAGLEMIPMLNQGSEGLAAVQEKARLYGERLAILAPEVDKLNDLMAELKLQSEATGASIATYLVPAVNKFLETLNKVGLSGSISATLDRAIVGGPIQDRIKELEAELAAREKARKTPGTMTGGGLLGALAGVSDVGLYNRIEGLKAIAASEKAAGEAAVGAIKARVTAEDVAAARAAARRLMAGQAGSTTKERELIDPLTKANADAYIKFFTDLGKAQDDALFGTQELTKAQQAFLELQASPLWQTMPETMRAWVVEQYRAVRANEDLAETQKKVNEQEEVNLKWTQERNAAAADELSSLLEKAKAAEDENARIGITTEQLGILTAQRYDEQIAIKRAEVERLSGIEDRKDEVGYIQQQIVALERLKNAEVARPALDRQAREWENFARDIESSLTGALMRSFESGNSFGKTFAQSLENTFKAMVLKFAVQGTVNSAMGAVGLGGYSAGGSGAAGYLNAGSSLYSAWNGTPTMSSAFGSFATSGAGSALGLSATLGAEEAAALGIADLAGATSLTTLGTTVTAAIPVIGWAVAAIALIAAFAGQGGGPKTEGDALFKLGGGLPSYAGSEGFFTGNSGDSLAKSITAVTAATVSETIKALGGTGSGLGVVMGFNTDPQGTAPDNITGAVSNAAGQYTYLHTYDAGRGDYSTQLQVEAQRVILAALKQSDINSLYKDLLQNVDIPSLTAEQASAILANINTMHVIVTNFSDLFGGQLSSELLTAMGGLDAMNSALSAYVDVAYSDAEKKARQVDALAAQFTALGLSLPSSVAELRKLVEAQDLSTEAGQQMFAALIKLAPALAQVGTAVGGLSSAVDAALSGVDRAIAAERERLQSGYDAALASFDAQIAAVNDHVSTLADLVATLNGGISGIGDTLGVTLAQRRAAQAEIISGAALAKAGGGLPNGKSLQAALGIFGKDAGGLYATRTDFLRDQSQTLAALSGLADLTGGQLTIEQQTLAELQASRKATEATYRRELATLDAQLAEAKNSVDVLKGIDTSVLSVAAAVEKLNAALRGGATSGGGAVIAGGGSVDAGGGGAGTTGTLGGFMSAYGGSNFAAMALRPDIAGLDKNAAGHWGWGTSPDGSQYWTWILDDVPAFAGGGMHDGGLRIVGERGPELEATGPARYFNNAQMRGLMSGGGDVAGELRALRAELAALRESNSAEGRAIAAATGKTARLLDRLMPDGDALAVRTAA